MRRVEAHLAQQQIGERAFLDDFWPARIRTAWTGLRNCCWTIAGSAPGQTDGGWVCPIEPGA